MYRKSDKLITGETYTVSAGDKSEEITIAAGENTIGQSAGGMGAPDGSGGNPPSRQPPNGESNKSENN